MTDGHDSPTLAAGRWATEPPLAPPPAPPPTPPSPFEPRRRAGWIAAIAVVMVLTAGAAFAVTTVVLDSRDDEPESEAAPIERDADTLGDLIVRQSDLPPGYSVILLPDGTDAVDQPTLDLCNGTYPSERLRTARRQVFVSPTDSSGFSTEAVLYENADATEQAFAELRDVVERCPDGPVRSPVDGNSETTRFDESPDAAWPQTRTVERQAYDLTSTDENGDTGRTIAVYLRRGRALIGLYFSGPKTDFAIAGQTDVADIVTLFAERLAGLPARVVG